MKKKIIFLNILSLVLLFALRGTTYADSYKEWTEADLKNYIYNSIQLYNNYDMDNAIDILITNYSTQFTDILNDINSYDYNGITIRDDGNTIDIQLFNTSNMQNTHPYISRNCLAFMNTPTGKGYWLKYNNNQQTWTISNTNINTAGSFNHKTTYQYFTCTVYTGGNNNTVKYQPNYYTPSIMFDGPFLNEQQFIFVPNSTTTVNVQGLTQTFYTIQKEALPSKFLGKLYKSRLTEGIYSDFYIYNTNSNSWNYLNERVVYNKIDGYIDEFFNTDKTHDYWITDIYIKNNIIAPNIFFRYQFYPMNADFDDYIDIWFYVTDTNTKYNNGVISPALTFSGDYLNEYKEITGQLNEAIENQKIQDKITDVNDTLTDNSQIDNIIAETLSGDNLMDSLGYSPLENPFTTIILNTMESFTDALLDSGNEVLTFTVFNNTITIHSEDFTLPNGNLKDFITLLCNAFVVYELIKYGFKLYQWINSGRLQNLVNETNNHQYYLF